MKLWQKIFLATLTLMVLSTTSVSILLLNSNQNALWQREGQRAVTQQQYLAGMLRAGVISHRLQLGQVQLEEEETQQAAIQVLSQQIPDHYLRGLILLDSSGNSLYNTMPEGLSGLELPTPSPDDPDATVYELREFPDSEDQWLLICSMPVMLESVPFHLGAAYFVGDLPEQLTAQAVETVTLCMTLSLVGAGVLLLLVWFLLRPLSELGKNARRIAEGNYNERMVVRGQDELAGVAQDMNAMAEAVQDRVKQLEQVAEDRRVFIGNLAHEMKTPLTSILGFADLLYLPKEVSSAQRVEYAQVISEEAKRLRSLSGKLLELITLGSTNLALEPTSLCTVADEVALSLQPIMAQSGLTLHVDCPEVSIDMDRELFKSLLYNLLDNGRKASKRGEQLALTAMVEGERVAILVRDHGRGIPQEEIEKITQPFYMVDKSRARKAGGAGLGLALCQEIVTVHSGTMEIQSVLGQGTLITLTFPISRRERGELHA